MTESSVTDAPDARIGYALTVVALPPLIYLGNPAIALLVAAVGAVTLNRGLIPNGTKVGGYALQTAIVLLGLKLDVMYVMDVSADFTAMIAVYVLLTLGVGLALGKLLRTEPASGKLVAAGTAICGGTTIASLSPVIRAKPEQTAVAMALVFLLNAVALFSFPMIGKYLDMTQMQFGVWAAIAIHDTSSVVATASMYGEEAAAVATTLKLGRTLWLIPLIVVFALLEKAPEARARVPVFVILFVAASIANYYLPLPAVVGEGAGLLSNALIVFALFCIGAAIGRETLKNLRGRVLVHGLLLWAIVIPTTLFASLYLA